MHEAIRAFGDELRGGGIGLFYYSGHALQVRGRNYLLPVRAMIEREDELVYRTVDVGAVLDKMESARNRVNIAILDACRSNPSGREFRTVATGLAVMDAPVNTLIAFATAPGRGSQRRDWEARPVHAAPDRRAGNPRPAP